jgi:hypothetical protein
MTARHHAIKYRQEGVDFFLRVDDLDHYRKILREAQKLAGISLLGGLGGPHPHFQCFDLSRENNQDKNDLVPIKADFARLRPCALLGAGRLVTAVLQHLDFLQRDEAAIHHSVENRQEFIDLLFGIHDFDHQGQIQ